MQHVQGEIMQATSAEGYRSSIMSVASITCNNVPVEAHCCEYTIQNFQSCFQNVSSILVSVCTMQKCSRTGSTVKKTQQR